MTLSMRIKLFMVYIYIYIYKISDHYLPHAGASSGPQRVLHSLPPHRHMCVRLGARSNILSSNGQSREVKFAHLVFERVVNVPKDSG